MSTVPAAPLFQADGARVDGARRDRLIMVNNEDSMAKEEAVELEGTIADVLPNTMFRVTLDNGHSLLATLGGKMRRFRIRVLGGDRVKVEVSPYDLTRGRITFRHKT